MLYAAAYLGHEINKYDIEFISVRNSSSENELHINDSYLYRLKLVNKWTSIITNSIVKKHEVNVEWGMVHDNDGEERKTDYLSLMFNDGDILSTNSLPLLDDYKKIRRIIWVSEGDLGFISSLKILASIIYRSKKFIYYTGFYDPPVYVKIVPYFKYIDYNKLTNLFDLILSKDDVLGQLVDEYRARNINNIYVPTDEIPSEEYESYLMRQIECFGSMNGGVIIKPHPRDHRDYTIYFGRLGIDSVQVKEEFIVYPAEVFSYKLRLKYYGGVSTSLLSFDPDDICCCMPCDKDLIKFYSNHYRGLLALINAEISNSGALIFK